jgi:hypothetical protein
MKKLLLLPLACGATLATAIPSAAQFTSFPTNSDGCSNLCIKFDVGSANNSESFGGFNSGFGSGFNSSPPSSGLRWQMSVTWRPNAPEVAQGEAERVKQKLEDNRTLMVSLAEAIAQDKQELARGLAIILAPRLNYSDPRQLLAEMKEGTLNVGAAVIKLE